MISQRTSRPLSSRRRAWRIAHVQAVLWSAGNALTSGTPLYFLAMELGGRNTEVGVLLALPTLLGILRLATPLLIARFDGDVKRACVALLTASYVIALGLPAIAYLAGETALHRPLLSLLVILGVHQSLEYLGLVALYAWLGDIVPTKIRGTFFGARQFWQLSIEIPVILASGFAIDAWSNTHPHAKLVAYAVALGGGVVCLFGSVAALTALKAPVKQTSLGQTPWREVLAPFADASFRRLLYYGCWFSTFNGLTASPQQTYPRQILGLGVFDLNAMRTGMRLGQFALSRPLGVLCDRLGHRPVLIVSQACVAAAPLCFFIATPKHAYWIAGAYALWSWYVGLNVGLPSLMLKLAPRGIGSPYVAAYFGVTGVCYAAATISGGYVLDRLITHYERTPLVGTWNIYHCAFFVAWITRTLGVGWLWCVREPGRDN